MSARRSPKSNKCAGPRGQLFTQEFFSIAGKLDLLRGFGTGTEISRSYRTTRLSRGFPSAHHRCRAWSMGAFVFSYLIYVVHTLLYDLYANPSLKIKQKHLYTCIIKSVEEPEADRADTPRSAEIILLSNQISSWVNCMCAVWSKGEKHCRTLKKTGPGRKLYVRFFVFLLFVRLHRPLREVALDEGEEGISGLRIWTSVSNIA